MQSSAVVFQASLWANRLTEDPGVTVVRGNCKSLYHFPTPGMGGCWLPATMVARSSLSPTLVNGNITIPPGKVIGSGSATNGMIFQRGSSKG